MRRVRLPLRIALGILVLACGSGDEGSERSLAAEVAAPQPSDAEIRAAFIAIYYAVEQPPFVVPLSLRPFSADRAVDILRRDHSSLRECRRRRAIVQFVGGSSVDGGRLGPEFAAELEALEAPIPEIEESLRALSPDPSREDKERIAYEVLARAGPAFAGCSTSRPVDSVETDAQKITTATVAFRIEEDLDRAAYALDPQSWSTCSPYFPETHLIRYEKGSPVRTTQCSVAPGKGAPRGTSWVGVIYEIFAAALGKDEIAIQNLLLIGAERESDRYRMDYALAESLCSELATDEEPHLGGLQVDWGYGEAIADAGDPGTFVKVVKRLRFAPREGIPWDVIQLYTEWSLKALCNESPCAMCCANAARDQASAANPSR